MELPPAPSDMQQHRGTVIHDAYAERMRRRDTEAPQRHYDATARALPDSLFKDHPEVILAREQASAAMRRVERMGTASKQAAMQLVQNLDAEVQATATEVQLAAIDDAIADDNGFPLALAAMERHEQMQRRLKAAQMAHEVLSKAPQSLSKYYELARKAESARDDLLLRLKREHLQAHPELLKSPSTPT